MSSFVNNIMCHKNIFFLTDLLFNSLNVLNNPNFYYLYYNIWMSKQKIIVPEILQIKP